MILVWWNFECSIPVMKLLKTRELWINTYKSQHHTVWNQISCVLLHKRNKPRHWICWLNSRREARKYNPRHQNCSTQVRGTNGGTPFSYKAFFNFKFDKNLTFLVCRHFMCFLRVWCGSACNRASFWSICGEFQVGKRQSSTQFN